MGRLIIPTDPSAFGYERQFGNDRQYADQSTYGPQAIGQGLALAEHVADRYALPAARSAWAMAAKKRLGMPTSELPGTEVDHGFEGYGATSPEGMKGPGLPNPVTYVQDEGVTKFGSVAYPDADGTGPYMATPFQPTLRQRRPIMAQAPLVAGAAPLPGPGAAQMPAGGAQAPQSPAGAQPPAVSVQGRPDVARGAAPSLQRADAMADQMTVPQVDVQVPQVQARPRSAPPSQVPTDQGGLELNIERGRAHSVPELESLILSAQRTGRPEDMAAVQQAIMQASMDDVEPEGWEDLFRDMLGGGGRQRDKKRMELLQKLETKPTNPLDALRAENYSSQIESRDQRNRLLEEQIEQARVAAQNAEATGNLKLQQQAQQIAGQVLQNAAREYGVNTARYKSVEQAVRAGFAPQQQQATLGLKGAQASNQRAQAGLAGAKTATERYGDDPKRGTAAGRDRATFAGAAKESAAARTTHESEGDVHKPVAGGGAGELITNRNALKQRIRELDEGIGAASAQEHRDIGKLMRLMGETGDYDAAVKQVGGDLKRKLDASPDLRGKLAARANLVRELELTDEKPEIIQFFKGGAPQVAPPSAQPQKRPGDPGP